MILRLTLLAALISTSALASPETDRWDRHKAAVTITRDDFGIPHIKGKTDADAVFGMIYAQAEDDFNRVETNFINAQGRLAETEGEAAIWRDLRMKLFIDPAELKAQYAASPAWLKSHCLGRCAERVSRQAPGGETPCHHPLRTVDGAQLLGRQHRRRYREHQSR
jgi:acyl-homoserine-lactone acylase